VQLGETLTNNKTAQDIGHDFVAKDLVPTQGDIDKKILWVSMDMGAGCPRKPQGSP
jgi:hypothetical protein